MVDLIQFLVIGVLLYVSTLYIFATIIKNWSIIDIAWGPGFVLISALALYHSSNFNLASIALTSMVLIWASRLAFHIGLRNIGKKEDFRYANWRKEWQPYPEIQGYFRVFLLQGTIMLIVSLPIILTIQFSRTGYDFIYSVPGIIIFALGLIIETIADRQLSSFKNKSENRGHLIKTGLWSISRHPNYLGEITLWWGIGLFALPFEYGYIGLLGPLCIHLIIRHISIPVLEEKWESKEEWKSIKENIPVLFPSFK